MALSKVNCMSSLPLFILNRAGKNAAHTKLDSLVDSKHYAFFTLVEMRKSCIALEKMLRFFLILLPGFVLLQEQGPIVSLPGHYHDD